jgi:hypothetical protein
MKQAVALAINRYVHEREGGAREDENLLNFHCTASDVYRENQISLG